MSSTPVKHKRTIIIVRHLHATIALMAVSSKSALIDALEAGDFDLILGTAECTWVDFKRSPYAAEPANPLRLSAKGRYELCKDVAELANDQGGVLLIGIQEILSAASGLSVADKITPVKVAAVDLAHYKQHLMSSVYPMVAGIVMKWYLTDEDKGILAIIIPKREDGYHIVKHTVDENGSTVHGLTIPIRADDQTYLVTPEHLYRLMQPKNIVNMRTEGSGEHLLSEKASVQQRLKESEKEAQKIRESYISSLDWSELPVLAIQAIPLSSPDRLDGFYDDVESAFRDTKPLRGMGFNLNSFGYETVTEDGAFIKSGIRDAALRLDPNGMLTMLIRGNENLLGWAVNKENETGTILINSFVLVEEVYEFVRFVNETLTKYGLKDWFYLIDIKRFKEYKLSLYPKTPHSWLSEGIKLASKDEYIRTVRRTDEYPKDVFNVLTEIYALFTLPSSAIPFSTNGKVSDKNILDMDKNLYGF